MHRLRRLILFSLCLFFLASPIIVHAQATTETPVPDTFYIARVVGEPQESVDASYGIVTITQTVEIELLDGESTGTRLTLPYHIPEGSPGALRYKEGDTLVVGKRLGPIGEEYYINDIYRLDRMWLVVGFFIALVLLLTRGAGIRALIGLGISFVVITQFIVPRIVDGQNALVVGLVGTIGIATASLYIAHGFRSRTTIAFVSTLITILISLASAILFTNAMKLFGLGSETAFFLQGTPGVILNLRGILIAGMIIGVLGVLDDITTAQAAVVEELHLANPSLNMSELFTRGSSVGREHIISLVNTLILAYTGAALPLFLMFEIYTTPAWLLLNSEVLMEEIVRMLVGSIALVLAVPLTTAFAAWYYGRHIDV